MSDIELLLAQADDNQPVLSEGLALEAAAEGPRPDQEDVSTSHYGNTGADPNDLEEQGWGLVVPDDKEVASRLLGLVAPLVQERKRQTGQEPKIYYVRPNMGVPEAADWWRNVYQDERVKDHERPRYLMLLGDADLISWELQQRLSLDIFAGRLAFPSDADYEAYVAKVLEYERAAPVDGARALFHTVRDGTMATMEGHRALMTPTVTNARETKGMGKFNAKEIAWLDEESADVSAEDFLAAAADPAPTMLFSISHGSGPPRADWPSFEQKLRFQGQMCMLNRQKITHEDVAHRPFLPGGAWFYFACLGAGTPATSAYRHWLRHLKEIGLYRDNLENVMRALPKTDERPFVARLPQAALANPKGPLSVIGHVDLAWTFGFQDYEVKDGRTIAKDRPSRFQSIFRNLVEGKRMGAGYTELQRHFNNANADLTGIFDMEERELEGGVSPKVLTPEQERQKKLKKASRWMERQDLAAYVLLGDPAVRINVNPARAQKDVSAAIPSVATRPASPPAPAPAQAQAPAPAPQPSGVKKLPDIEAMERAILPILTEDATAKKVAEKLGVETDDVKAWVKAYQEAGRKALRDL